MSDDEIAAIKEFIGCARRGSHLGASSGESACYFLGKQAKGISALMQDIDDGKKEGFLKLLLGLAWPDTRETLLEALPK